MKKQLLMTSMFITLLTATAQARSPMLGGQDRGGGRGVLCTNPDGSVQSLELKDYHEARTSFSLLLDLGPNNLSYKEKIAYALNRLKNVDLVLAEYLEKEVAEFESQTNLIDTGGIRVVEDVSDSDLILPQNCREVQMAINKVDPMPFEKTYLIDLSFWNIANEDTKAGLVLHEIIYRMVRQNGDKTSDNARYLTALVSSSQILDIKACDYGNIIYKMYSSYWSAIGAKFSLKAPNGGFILIGTARCDMSFISGKFYKSQIIQTSKGPILSSHASWKDKFLESVTPTLTNPIIKFKSGSAIASDISFHKNGNVAFLESTKGTATIFGLKYQWDSSPSQTLNTSLNFDENEEIIRVQFGAAKSYNRAGATWNIVGIKKTPTAEIEVIFVAPFPSMAQKQLRKQYGAFFGRPSIDKKSRYIATFKGQTLVKVREYDRYNF